MGKRIALIFHEHERKRNLPDFAIWHLAEIWKKEGIQVDFLFGTKKFIPADLAILHVDLTVVPQEYIEFASRYPVAINGNLRDIRKSRVSKNRVFQNDGYEGRVIVKSELNYAGQPERKLLGTPLSRIAFRIACHVPFYRPANPGPEPHFRSPGDYIIYDSPRSVPEGWFHRNDILVEKFVPEMQDGLYCLRSFSFLGSHSVCTVRKANHPIVYTSTTIKREMVEAHPQIVELARIMGFDFGKFDFVVHEGAPVLLDANKTPGAGRGASYLAICPEWAKGIHTYL